VHPKKLSDLFGWLHDKFKPYRPYNKLENPNLKKSYENKRGCITLLA